MGKLCNSNQKPRSHRRLHGAQLPWNCQQVIAWIVFVATALVNFIVVVEIQFHELKIVAIVVYVMLYVSHVVSHGKALLTDPAEKELRKLQVNTVPEFDRSLHAHVIENGRCHLCNIYATSKRTKHCSLCNKCVDRFDHHCKWLNNCVGKRNYSSFLACVITAFLISVFTCSLCLSNIVLFLSHPKRLSPSAQNFINCATITGSPVDRYCSKSIAFLVFLITYCVSTVAVACALLHLFCFHVYISMIGVSTYEYIVKSSTPTPRPECKDHKCCKNNLYAVRKHDDKNARQHSNENPCDDNATKTGIIMNANGNSQSNNVTSLVGIFIANEVDTAKKMFMFDKNKVHPHNSNNSTS